MLVMYNNIIQEIICFIAVSGKRRYLMQRISDNMYDVIESW